jgi:hypothetical protein
VSFIVTKSSALFFVTIVCLKVCLLHESLGAASLHEVSMEELASRSNFCGRVVVETQNEAEISEFPYQVYQARVLEVLRGSQPSGRRVQFYSPGGSKQQRQLQVSGSPRFSVGAEYVICLSADPRRNEMQMVSFWTSFRVGRDEQRKKFLVRDGEFMKRSSSRALRAAEFAGEDRVRSYDEVVTRILDSN